MTATHRIATIDHITIDRRTVAVLAPSDVATVYRRGDFAVHRADEGGYAISHVPTGARLHVGGLTTRRKAESACSRIARAYIEPAGEPFVFGALPAAGDPKLEALRAVVLRVLRDLG